MRPSDPDATVPHRTRGFGVAGMDAIMTGDERFADDELAVPGAEQELAAPAAGLNLLDEEPAEEEEEEAIELEISTDSLQLFLKDIGKVDLLTAAQEVELAKRIERGDMSEKQEMVE